MALQRSTVTERSSATERTATERSSVAARVFDTTPPSLSNVSATNPSLQNVEVSFDSDEQLSGEPQDIQVSISGAESGSLNGADFTESGSGPYTYTGTYVGSTGGDYTATIDTAKDLAGNDGATGQSVTVTISNGSLPSFTFTISTTQAASDFTWSVSDDGSGDTYDAELVRTSDSTVVDTITGYTGSASSTYTPSGSIGDEIDYRVRKIRQSDSATGLSSNTETITIEEAPDPITDLSATGGTGQVDLSWTAPDTTEGDVQSQEVHRSTTSGFNPSAGDSTLVADLTAFTEGSTKTYTDDGSGQKAAPSSTTTYYYKVISVDADGFTADSNEASATPS
jgi:hypothetical protein